MKELRDQLSDAYLRKGRSIGVTSLSWRSNRAIGTLRRKNTRTYIHEKIAIYIYWCVRNINMYNDKNRHCWLAYTILRIILYNAFVNNAFVLHCIIDPSLPWLQMVTRGCEISAEDFADAPTRNSRKWEIKTEGAHVACDVGEKPRDRSRTRSIHANHAYTHTCIYLYLPATSTVNSATWSRYIFHSQSNFTDRFSIEITSPISQLKHATFCVSCLTVLITWNVEPVFKIIRSESKFDYLVMRHDWMKNNEPFSAFRVLFCWGERGRMERVLSTEIISTKVISMTRL